METRPSISGNEDPDGEAPWAMQLVARVEKALPPTHVAVCEAAAKSVVQLLADPRSQFGGEWFPAVQRWEAGRIRKLARKARGSQWDRVQELAGISVVHNGAGVRAFVPSPIDKVPAEISRLQLQGFDLESSGQRRVVEPEQDGPVIVSITPEPRLTTGKAAAATSHAAQLAYSEMDAPRRAAWAAISYSVSVELAAAEEWEERISAAQVVVEDAGFTEVVPGTATAIARWR
jgi:peptidyl-tRNA hydrolase